ncbi:hypothetical protein FKM82_030217 [Ascaphus truei]
MSSGNLIVRYLPLLLLAESLKGNPQRYLISLSRSRVVRGFISFLRSTVLLDRSLKTCSFSLRKVSGSLSLHARSILSLAE